MKKVIILFLLVFIVNLTKAGDVLTLANCQQFYGKVLKVNDHIVLFKCEKELYEIPSTKVYSIQFENSADSVLNKYVSLKDSLDLCSQATKDAALYHGRVFDHVALGCLFGLCGVVGSALSQPSPNKDIAWSNDSKYKKTFENPIYIECYRKKARNMNVLNSVWGWGVFVAVYFTIRFSAIINH